MSTWIEVDERRLPLFTARFRGNWTDEQLTSYLSAHLRVLQRRERIAAVFDLTQAGAGSAHQRKHIAAWLREHLDLIKNFTLGTSLAITSPLVRGAFTAILWLQPLPNPHHVATTVADAERWAIDRLLASGRRLPPTTPSRKSGCGAAARP